MSSLARWCASRRLTVVGAWVLLIIVLGGAAATSGAAFTDSTNSSDSESSTAYSLIDSVANGDSEKTETGTIVWETGDTPVDDATVQQEAGSILDAIGASRGVSVVSPYSPEGAAQIDPDRNVAYAAVTLTPDADADKVREAVADFPRDTFEVHLGGQAFTENPAAGGTTEIIGIIGALVILLIVFRSMWAAVLPVVTGIVGVITSLLVVVLASNVVDLASSTPTMGALIGLGVGIDYALFIVYRYRKGLLSGLSVENAIVRAIDTSGRAVIFAGATVVIALLGVFIVNIDILTGMARGAALTVVLTVVTALTLLPAMLSLLGPKVLSRRLRRDLAARPAGEPAPAADTEAGRVVTAWSSVVERRPRTVAAVATGLIVVLALPALTIRLGSADPSSDPSGTDSRAFYDTMSTSFGDGYDASLVIAATTPDAASLAAFEGLVEQMRSVEDVESVGSSPVQEGQTISIATVVPSSSAQTEETADLVERLRTDVIPAAEAGNDLEVFVGGRTASGVDSAEATVAKLPVYLLLVAALGFVLLAVAFRSILVPLIGAVGNLLTLAVALGAVSFAFQRDWTAELLGVGGSAPIESIVPVLVIGIMFGLAMDYQVFLVSRMHEEWSHTRDNRRAIKVGMQETGRVISTAALIMVCVFASFGVSGQRIIAEIGIALAVGVLVDAFVMRMTIVPALMHLIGDRNWYYPRWADRITPHLSVEGQPDAAASQERPTSDEDDALEPAGR
jgi:RND superfamily putative drug exporter